MAKQNIEAIAKWQKENTDFIRFRARKELHLPERAELAVQAGIANSKQDFYIKAILEKLERDGIPMIEGDDAQEDNE